LIFRCQKLLTGKVPASRNNDIQPASGKVAECQSSRKSIRVPAAGKTAEHRQLLTGRVPASRNSGRLQASGRVTG